MNQNKSELITKAVILQGLGLVQAFATERWPQTPEKTAENQLL